MAETLELTSIPAGNGWYPSKYEVLQLRDYLDFRAFFGTTPVSILRLQSNRDVHFYGELILHDGGVRSFDTFGITCVQSSQDIVSFRSGGSEGSEKLRIRNDGVIAAAVESLVVIDNPTSGDGDILQLRRRGAAVLTFSGSVGNNVSLTLPSGYDLFVKDETGSRVKLGVSTSTTQDYQIYDSAAQLAFTLIVDDNSSIDDTFVRVGGTRSGTNSRRGRVFIQNDSKTDAQRPGLLVLLDKNAGERFLWVDSSGKLRIHTADPDTNDTLGTIVGTQT